MRVGRKEKEWLWKFEIWKTECLTGSKMPATRWLWGWDTCNHKVVKKIKERKDMKGHQFARPAPLRPRGLKIFAGLCDIGLLPVPQ